MLLSQSYDNIANILKIKTNIDWKSQLQSNKITISITITTSIKTTITITITYNSFHIYLEIIYYDVSLHWTYHISTTTPPNASKLQPKQPPNALSTSTPY